MNKNISVSLSQNLLKDIEENIEGSNRSQKICKCVQKGYELLTKDGESL